MAIYDPKSNQHSDGSDSEVARQLYSFDVRQELKGYYKGEITVLASSRKEATAKIKAMSQDDLDASCDGWEHGDEYNPSGPIEVYNDKGKIIKS